MPASSVQKWLRNQSIDNLKIISKTLDIILRRLNFENKTTGLLRIDAENFKRENIDCDEAIGIGNKFGVAMVSANQKMRDELVDRANKIGINIPPGFYCPGMPSDKFAEVQIMISKIIEERGIDINTCIEMITGDFLFYEINDALELQKIRKKIDQILEKAEPKVKQNGPSAKPIDFKNIQPVLKEEGGFGYFKFRKNDPNPGIKIGDVKTKKCRLLFCLIEPYGTAKNIETVFDAIRNPKDDLDSRLRDRNTRNNRIITLLNVQIKELQKNGELKGRISLSFAANNKSVRLELH